MLKLFQFWLLGNLYVSSCAPSTDPITVGFGEERGTSLLSDAIKYFRLMFCISCLSPRISHFSKSSGSFDLRILLKTKIGMVGGLIATGVLPCLLKVNMTGKKLIPDHNIILSLETLVDMSNNLF